MHAKGSISFGGVGFGAVVVDMQTDDGHKYHFSGYYANTSPEGAYGTDFEGDFQGLSHILGSCAFEIAAGGLGPGGAEISFWDLHGGIGTLAGYVFGGGIQFGIGGGTWSDEEYQQSKTKLDKSIPAGKKKKGVTLDDLAWLLLIVDNKINMLIENAGLGDKLAALADELHGPTEALRAAVEANQPTKEKKKDNG